jgi:hypothetical protein
MLQHFIRKWHLKIKSLQIHCWSRMFSPYKPYVPQTKCTPFLLQKCFCNPWPGGSSAYSGYMCVPYESWFQFPSPTFRIPGNFPNASLGAKCPYQQKSCTLNRRVASIHLLLKGGGAHWCLFTHSFTNSLHQSTFMENQHVPCPGNIEKNAASPPTPPKELYWDHMHSWKQVWIWGADIDGRTWSCWGWCCKTSASYTRSKASPTMVFHIISDFFLNGWFDCFQI